MLVSHSRGDTQDNKTLIEAIKNRNLAEIQYLVENGADVQANNNEAMQTAINAHFPEIVQYLLDHGAQYPINYDLNKAYFSGYAMNIPRYKLTRRPYSRMTNMVNNKIPNRISNLYLPVVRYEGLYRKSRNQDCCGRFYYFEPDSSVLLDLGRVAAFPSKVAAYTELLARLNKLGITHVTYANRSFSVNSETMPMFEVSNYQLWRYILAVNGLDPELRDYYAALFYNSFAENPDSIPHVPQLGIVSKRSI